MSEKDLDEWAKTVVRATNVLFPSKKSILLSRYLLLASSVAKTNDLYSKSVFLIMWGVDYESRLLAEFCLPQSTKIQAAQFSRTKIIGAVYCVCTGLKNCSASILPILSFSDYHVLESAWFETEYAGALFVSGSRRITLRCRRNQYSYLTWTRISTEAWWAVSFIFGVFWILHFYYISTLEASRLRFNGCVGSCLCANLRLLATCNLGV